MQFFCKKLTSINDENKSIPVKHLFVLKLSNPYISRTPIKDLELGS
jgi:hypothetical protein